MMRKREWSLSRFHSIARSEIVFSNKTDLKTSPFICGGSEHFPTGVVVHKFSFSCSHSYMPAE